jgi:hypothetical protein
MVHDLCLSNGRWFEAGAVKIRYKECILDRPDIDSLEPLSILQKKVFNIGRKGKESWGRFIYVFTLTYYDRFFTSLIFDFFFTPGCVVLYLQE